MALRSTGTDILLPKISCGKVSDGVPPLNPSIQYKSLSLLSLAVSDTSSSPFEAVLSFCEEATTISLLSSSSLLFELSITAAVIPPPTTATAQTPAITFAFTVENIPFPPDIVFVDVTLSGTALAAEAEPVKTVSFGRTVFEASLLRSFERINTGTAA